MRRSVTAAAAVLTALALTPVTLSAAAAPYKGANTAAVQDDFNGDGYRDLAVGAPHAANGTAEGAGAVVVLYGSRSSVSTTRRQVVSQNTAGIPGTGEDSDAFGAAVASADLDRDGYADLIVGAPGEDAGSLQSRGAVSVVWGGARGLGGASLVALPAGYGEGRTYCRFGLSLATGDMNGDGAPELSVGSGCDAVSYTGPFTRRGAAADRYIENRVGDVPAVVMGDVNGDGRAERFWLAGAVSDDHRGTVWLDLRGTKPRGEYIDNWPLKLPYADGYSGRIGDINGDGYGDLVTGIPSDPALGGDARKGGEIQVLYGSAHGITPTQKPAVIHQDTPGVPGTAQGGDGFGYALSVGDVDGDRYADVAVGVPFKNIGTRTWAGAAVLLRGSARGLTTAGARFYSQNTSGVPDTAETYDFFGTAVHLADLTADRRAETVIGVPGENTDGALWTARGASTGPAPAGSVHISGKSAGITVRGLDAEFGAALPSSQAER
ncbi:hypothetical protein [Streptomyces sp. NPDC058739]|uniref:hypothetical protein n=1 Tax=Streptomyces sp. NPDC058739 TaxID=3346618 RepID=UPI0036B00787